MVTATDNTPALARAPSSIANAMSVRRVIRRAQRATCGLGVFKYIIKSTNRRGSWEEGLVTVNW